ncbi:organic solvent tolerance protein OstA [Selenomonadales bacterium OttesenSCG-928-I06]|nr:organic solvent tolerance protein OstA [Selenomonadales bacterium OttesenSCG-928-I06]
MNKRILVLCLVFCFLLAGIANAAMPTIKADKTYYDINTGLYVLDGNVYIESKNRVVTAGHAKVSVDNFEVWGTGGITFKQDDIHFKGGSVYVYGKNKRAEIAGGVDFERTDVHITSDSAEYNWKSKVAIFKGNVNVNENGNTWQSDSVSYNVISNTFL